MLSGRRGAGLALLLLAFAAMPTVVGCGGGAETGDVVKEVEGQVEGERKSREAMERMMNEGTDQ